MRNLLERIQYYLGRTKGVIYKNILGRRRKGKVNKNDQQHQQLYVNEPSDCAAPNQFYGSTGPSLGQANTPLSDCAISLQLGVHSERWRGFTQGVTTASDVQQLT